MNINPELLLPIVAKLSEAYTSKESSSISYNAARQLMGAVLYCLNENESTNEIPNTAALTNTENETDLFAAYKEGYQLVLKKVCKAKDIYNDLIATFNSFGNSFLKDTIQEGMPAFFLYYDAKFNPQNHILTLDYSTLKSTDSLQGVDTILQYLTYIKLEQDFFSALPCEYIHSILNGYQEDYTDLPINICEIVFHHLLACTLIEKDLSTTRFDKEDIEKASDYLLTHTKAEINADLTRLTKFLVKTAYQNNPELFDYLASNIADFTTSLLNAAKHDCLHTIFYLNE